MGRQFAADSATPSPIACNRDKYMDEIPMDRPMHENSTPAEGAFNWGALHYCDYPNGSYGAEVSAKGVSSDSVDVNPSAANRGKDE